MKNIYLKLSFCTKMKVTKYVLNVNFFSKVFQFLCFSYNKGPVIIYRLGGGGGEIWGHQFIFRKRKRGESVVTENPKEGDR